MKTHRICFAILSVLLFASCESSRKAASGSAYENDEAYYNGKRKFVSEKIAQEDAKNSTDSSYTDDYYNPNATGQSTNLYNRWSSGYSGNNYSGNNYNNWNSFGNYGYGGFRPGLNLGLAYGMNGFYPYSSFGMGYGFGNSMYGYNPYGMGFGNSFGYSPYGYGYDPFGYNYYGYGNSFYNPYYGYNSFYNPYYYNGFGHNPYCYNNGFGNWGNLWSGNSTQSGNGISRGHRGTLSSGSAGGTSIGGSNAEPSRPKSYTAGNGGWSRTDRAVPANGNDRPARNYYSAPNSSRPSSRNEDRSWSNSRNNGWSSGSESRGSRSNSSESRSSWSAPSRSDGNSSRSSGFGGGGSFGGGGGGRSSGGGGGGGGGRVGHR